MADYSLIKCPKCGYVNKPTATNCAACNVNLSRVRENRQQHSGGAVQTSVLEEGIDLSTYKGFGIRALAYILDSIAIMAISFGMGLIVGGIIAVMHLTIGRGVPPAADSNIVDKIVGIVLFLIYFMILEYLYGATIGKLILGLRVIAIHGKALSVRQAVFRGLWRLVDGFFFGLPAYSAMKNSELRQRIGDGKHGTVVVSAKDPGIRESKSVGWFILGLFLYGFLYFIYLLITVFWL